MKRSMSTQRDGVAPLVVVPAMHLHQLPSMTFVVFASRMHDAGSPMKSHRHELLLGVAKDALQRSLGAPS